MLSRQPTYRRPSWAKKTSSYEIYMRKDLAADRSPGTDHGVDLFSYDDAHLAQWQLPVDFLNRLPPQLQEMLKNWQAAGAAINTALERVERLYDQSLHRGWPEKSHSHLSRTTSHSPSTSRSTASLSSPPMTPSPAVDGISPSIATTGLPALLNLRQPVSPLDINLPYLTKSISPLDIMPPQGIGMESPPFTPIDSQALATPSNPVEATRPVMPDLQHINTQLSQVSLQDSFTSTSPVFDESAWDVYVNSVKVELHDLRSNSLLRLKHIGRTIDIFRIEQATDHEVDQEAMQLFNGWWFGVQTKVREYESKVKDLKLPDVNDVRAERMARGLVV